MPQLVTHHIFANEVYNELDKNIQNSFKNELDVYRMFAQSFDNFNYFASLNFKKSKRIKNLADRGHKTNVKNYFVTILKTIKEKKLENDPQALAYLFGSINHYVLDSTCHPFIFYKTGVYDKKKKRETKKYRGLHGDIESNIDAFFYINRYHHSYNKARITKEFIPKIKFSKNLKEVINQTFEETFNEKNVGKYYFSSYRNSRLLYKLFIEDKHGIKRFCYKIFDKFISHTTSFEYYTTYIRQPKISYLNIEHKKWFYPSNNKISSTESFIDLYNKAIQKSSFLISLAYDVLTNKKEIKEFEEKIENLSYVRGLDCDNSRAMRHFEF